MVNSLVPTVNFQANRSRRLKQGTSLVGGLLLVAWAVLGSVMLRTPPRDYATSRMSDRGRFFVTIVPASEPIPINQVHNWTLHIESPLGAVIDNATITVGGDMPEHGHGLPTAPKVTQYLGNGDYLVEGMKFHMTGWWVMDFDVTAYGQTDHVSFNLLLQ